MSSLTELRVKQSYHHQTLDITWPYLQTQSGSGIHWTEHTCRVLGSREFSSSFGKGSVVQFAVLGTSECIRKLVKLVMTWHNQQVKKCQWSFGHSFLCAYEAGLHGWFVSLFLQVGYGARDLHCSQCRWQLGEECHVFCCRKVSVFRCPPLRPYPGWDLGWLKQGWRFVLGVSVAVLTVLTKRTRVIFFLKILMFRSLDCNN